MSLSTRKDGGKFLSDMGSRENGVVVKETEVT